jgi:outer membrane protein assembly factor BamE (lipoprotein component of BamABCDE complex)
MFAAWSGAVLACMVIACLSGCATPGGSAAPSLTRATLVPTREATSRIVIGKSTKPEVAAALGRTTAITFDSGYEIWVYHLAANAGDDNRSAGNQPKSEFVVLFSPMGVVTKTRVRPPPISQPG